jgi:hypothetical protein
VYFCLIVLLLLEPGAVDAPGGAFGAPAVHPLVLEGLEACDVKSE